MILYENINLKKLPDIDSKKVRDYLNLILKYVPYPQECESLSKIP